MRVCMDESSLCDLIKFQDREAFTYLYDNYSPAVFGEIVRIVKSREAAEDLLQDVFITIWQKGDQYDRGKGRLFTWILSITRNKCIDHLRKSNNTPKYISSESLMMVKEPQQQNKALEFSMMYKDFKGINPKHLELIRLVYIYGYTQHEASAKCAIPVGTVKTILRKFIISIREKYTDPGNRILA